MEQAGLGYDLWMAELLVDLEFVLERMMMASTEAPLGALLER